MGAKLIKMFCCLFFAASSRCYVMSKSIKIIEKLSIRLECKAVLFWPISKQMQHKYSGKKYMLRGFNRFYKKCTYTYTYNKQTKDAVYLFIRSDWCYVILKHIYCFYLIFFSLFILRFNYGHFGNQIKQKKQKYTCGLFIKCLEWQKQT